MLDRVRYRLSLRLDYDGELFGELSTWLWHKLARGSSKDRAWALYKCEHANRVELGEKLRETGASAWPNPLVLGPAVATGALAAVTPEPVQRAVLNNGHVRDSVRAFYERKAARNGDPELYQRLTDRHLQAFE